MKRLKVIVLVHELLIPPEKISNFDLAKAPWITEYNVIEALKKLNHQVLVLGIDKDLDVIKNTVNDFRPDIVFNLLEQFDGDPQFDYSVVAYLELLKIPYTGCNPKGLHLARDKSLSKKILSYHNIKTPHFEVVPKSKKVWSIKNIEFPLIVKSLTEEGSVGISQSSIVTNEAKLRERVKFVHESVNTDAIVESFIGGVDIYVSILGNKRLKVFPILELVFENAPDSIHKIATSRVKWTPEYRKKYKIDWKFLENSVDLDFKKIEELSKKIYRALDLSGYARLDLRLTDDKKIYFIEANPNPDICFDGEFAMSAEKEKVFYSKLLDKILQLGLNYKIGDID